MIPNVTATPAMLAMTRAGSDRHGRARAGDAVSAMNPASAATGAPNSADATNAAHKAPVISPIDDMHLPPQVAQ